MQLEEFIPAGEFCSRYHIEFSFVSHLYDSGLIAMTPREGDLLLPADELPTLEKFIRWHYDLAINTEGIEVISHLLGRLDELQQENQTLRNRLRRFSIHDGRPVEPGEEI